MNKSLKKNYIFNLVYQILILFLPLITTPYVSRVLGASNLGIYSFTTSITAYFILFGNLGINLYGQREIAFFQKDKKMYSKVFYEINIFKNITMLISMFLFYLLFILRANEYNLYFKILLIELSANIFDISWFFQGMEDFKKTISRNSIIKIICVILIFNFVKSKDDLVIYFIIYSLSNLLGNISMWLYIPRYICKISLQELNIFKLFKPTISFFIPQIAIQLYTVLDRTMIGLIISDKSQVGFYDQTQKIIKILLTIVTALGTVMLPRIANNFANGNNQIIREYIYKSLRVANFMAFPFIFGICIISKDFVPLFLGNGYDDVIYLLYIVSPIILFIATSSTIGNQFLLPTKRQKEFTISVVVGALVNLVLNLILIYKFSSVGASIATVIAELSVASIQLYFVRHDLSIKKIIMSSKNYFLSSVLMFVICNFINFINLPIVLSLIFKIIIGVIIYIVSLIILKDDFIYEIQHIINKVLKNHKRA